MYYNLILMVKNFYSVLIIFSSLIFIYSGIPVN